MKVKAPIAAVLTAAAAWACASYPSAVASGEPPAYPAARFVVLSDPHLFDAASSEAGPAWERGLSSGIKLLAESAEIFRHGYEEIVEVKPDFLIIPGDLTKDGERESHLLMARMLLETERLGIRVFVAPGNHDVLNPHAARFVEDKAEKAETVTPEDFSRIYGEFGYSEALYSDDSSLSYVAEPVDGLWLIALDTCRYGENPDHPVTEGRLRPETSAWLSRILAQAGTRSKQVIAFMHHGAMEHFFKQDSYLGQYVLADHRAAARLLAGGGVRAVFTGHGHAQDITVERFEDGGYLFDIQTGSLSSFPNPYRIVEIDADGLMRIESRFITTLGTTIDGHAEGFPAYSLERLYSGLTGTALSVLSKVCVGGADAERIAGLGVEAAADFYRGDEPGRGAKIDTTGMGCWPAFVAGILAAPLSYLGTDLIPVDNDIVIDLGDGSWR
jgi:hypothetical protein